MSSNTASAEPGAARIVALRLLLVGAYFLLAHQAGADRPGSALTGSAYAALALGDIALLVLLPALLQGRPRAWAWLALAAAALWWLARTRYALLPLLLVPAAILAVVGTAFGRTLRRGRMPLITRIATAMEGELAPPLQRYTRALTAAWTALLALLALGNLGLALLAVPHGVLARLGVHAPLAVTQAQWEGWGDGVTYGALLAFLWLEFAYRQRRFPDRYRGFADFLRRMARLGPAFWSRALR